MGAERAVAEKANAAPASALDRAQIGAIRRDELGQAAAASTAIYGASGDRERAAPASRPALSASLPPATPSMNAEEMSAKARAKKSESAAGAATASHGEAKLAMAAPSAPAAAPAVPPAARQSAPTRIWWSISPDGKLQRSRDRLSWETVEPGKGVAFRVVASIGSEVWAGGSGGALYHSSDHGNSWHEVPVGPPQPRVRDAITSLEFSDANQGTLTTAIGDQWSTRDGGLTWEKMPSP